MVSIFEINSQKKKGDPKNTYTIQTGGNRVGPQNPFLNQGKTYTQEMKKLDDELINEGVKIERLSDKEKRSYVNSLTDTEYNRLTQYRDAGYSFGASKALVDMEKQASVNNGMGGLRGQGFQLNEPLGGKNSVWNRSNLIGRVSEALDDWIQQKVVPAMTVDLNDSRRQKLQEKYNNLTDADMKYWESKFNAEPEWRKKLYKMGTDEKTGEPMYDLDKYRTERNTSWLDSLAGVELDKDNPTVLNMVANAPASLVSNVSAIGRGLTNPLDTLNMLKDLVATEEGREVIRQRYLTPDGLINSIETDPIGVASDFSDAISLASKPAVRGTKATAWTTRMAGATDTANKISRFGNKLNNISNTAGSFSDLGMSEGYNKILSKSLGRLSEGGKVSNLIGDYLSLTQRPLATLRAGANPKDEKGNKVGKTNGQWTISGIENGVNKVISTMKDRIQTQATGLTPEARERIRQNPFIKDYRERIEAMINEEGAPLDNQKIMEGPIEEVGQELLRRLEEYESRLQEDGKEYQVLDSTTRPYNISSFLYKVYDVFAKNGISLTPDGELSFRTTANPADMNPVNVAWNVIRAMEPNLQNMTIKQIREFRQQLRSLIKYQSDAPSTKYSKKVLREIVDGALNSVVHKEIPSLAKVDEIYTKRLKEIKEFKDGLVYQVGEKKGQIKDNFYSIISTLNTQNRQKMKARVEKLFPDLGARVEAIRMLPLLAKTYQNSPQMMRALFQKAGFLGGISQSGGVKRAIMGWLLGIVADELFAKPMGEKWRKQAIDELLNEVSPEAIQKLAEIKSKVDAGIELSEQEKRDLATAMQEIAEKEYEYLDEQHKKEFDKIMESANNQQPKLPAPGMDVINPDGTIRLGTGNPLNSPETYKPKTREERVQKIQQEYEVEPERAEEMADSIEDFLDEIGGDINGEVNPREVNYEKFSTRTLNELMKDDLIPQSEKDKIGEILSRRDMKETVRSETEADHDFAYRINKLQEEELRIGKVGKNKVNKTVADQQMRAWEKKKEKLIKEMEEYYGIDQFQAQDKYLELESKGDDYINEYKNSKRFQEDQAELQVLNQLKEEWKKQKKFMRDMDGETAKKRDKIVSQELQNGYEWETTDYGDRFINKQTGDKGIVKYGPDGKISVVFTPIGYTESGITDILPGETEIRFEGESDTIPLSEIKQPLYTDDEIPEFQTVGRANPNEKDITAEEGLAMKNFRDGRTAQELADDYGLEVAIVEKIFTEAGEEALGRAKGNLIELVRQIKEGTAPHEVFHPIFNMVNAKRRAEIIDLVRKNKGMTEKEAKEWLADNFSEYFRTGKFDTKPIPKGFVNKVKWFFNKVKEFVNGMYKDRKKIQKLFDDIMDGKIETDIQTDMIGEYFYNKKGDSPLNLHNGRSTGKPPKSRLSITDGNSSVYKNKLDDLRSRTDSLDSQQFIDELRGIFVTPEESNYLFRDINGEPYTLRVADHGASTKNYKNYKQFKNNTSVVVEFTKKRWRSNDVVDLLELRYDKDTLTDSQKKGIIDGIKDWMDTGEYTDKQYNSKKVSPKTEEEYQYQIQQKSLFDEGEPSNEEIGNFIVDEYPKINSRIQPLAERNGYTMEAFARRLDSAYDPDIETWRKTLKDEEIDLTPEELVMITDTIKTMVDDPKTEKIISKIQQGPIKAFRRLLERMKENPLNIPESLGGLAKVKEKQGWSPLERYLENNPNKIDIFYKTYDPDIVERRGNLQKKGRTDITMKDLYEVKNMIDDHIKNKGTNVDKGVPDQPTAELFTEKVQALKKEKTGTYDKKQIQRIADDLDGIIQRRIDSVEKIYDYQYLSNDQTRENEWRDFQDQFVRDLGTTYDPDISKRHKNLIEKMKETMSEYEGFNAIKRYDNIIYEHQLNSLKSKIEELSKYSYSDITRTLDGRLTDVFMQAVKPRIEELKAKGVEKAVTNLVALHNIDIVDFDSVMKDFKGKNPMPSIAVMDVNVPHEVFGDLTLVFGRDTVDPKVDPANKIYGSDAWTPTFPSVKEVGGVSYDEIKKFVGDKIDNMIDRGLDIDPGEAGYLWNDITRLISEYSEKPNVQGDAGHYAEQIIDDLYEGGYENFIKSNEEAVEELKEDIWTFLENIPNDRRKVIPAEYFESGYFGNVDTVAEQLLKLVPDETRSHYDEGSQGDFFLTSDIKEVLGRDYTDKADILDALEREFGIEDSEELRTLLDTLKEVEQGDRPLTPENVLEAMKNQKNKRNVHPGEFEDMIEIEGHQLNDIEDVRRQNFAKVFHGDRTGDLGDLKTRYDKLAEMVVDEFYQAKNYDKESGNGYLNDVEEFKHDVKNSYSPDLETFKDNLRKNAPVRLEYAPDEVLQRIIDVVEQGKKIPIRFSESKPERIVDLTNEVQYILAPEGKQAVAVMKIVKGTPLENKVVTYKPDDFSAPRSQVLKELQRRNGNVFFSMGGVIMPIAMLYLMMQQGDEDQGEGQQA